MAKKSDILSSDQVNSAFGSPSGKNIYDPIGEMNLLKFEVLKNTVLALPTVLLKLISEYWFLFSETVPRFIPNFEIHYVHDITFSQRNGKIILATDTDEYYKSNLLIYDSTMRLESKCNIRIRVKKILSSKLSYPDGRIYIVVAGYIRILGVQSYCIIIYSFEKGILTRILEIPIIDESPIFIDMIDRIYYRLGNLIRSKYIREFTDYYDYPVRSIKDDFAVTDDGVLFSLEKVVKKGSGNSMVIRRLVDDELDPC